MTTTKMYLRAYALILGLPRRHLRFAGAIAAPGRAGSAQYSADPDWRCDILEVKRVSDGALNIRWRIINTAGQPGGLTGTAAKSIRYDFGWDQIYFIDPAENKSTISSRVAARDPRSLPRDIAPANSG